MRARAKTTIVLPIAIGAVLLLPGPAHADTLHAAPDGSGATCTASEPCELETAVEDVAISGDTVIAHPGTYDLGVEQLVVKAGVTVRGIGPGKRPVISSTCCENPGVFPTALMVGQAAAVRDLEVIHPGRPSGGYALEIVATNGPAGTAERVVAIGPTIGCLVFPGQVPDFTPPVVSDSVCVSTGEAGVAASMFIFPGDTDRAAELSGVTAYALGDGGVGLRLSANGTGTAEVVARVSNSILAGDAVDVRTAEADDLTASVILGHSNYATTDSASGGTVTAPATLGNQTGTPLLAAPADFDFTQRPGSPTIDAGDDGEALGEFDLDGDPRILAAVDIGADEHRPRCAGKPATIVAIPGVTTVGTPGRDVIVGTSKADVIRARGGRDLICSLGGRDRVNGGAGTDVIRAGGGNDRASGGGGKRDRVLGQAGNDRLSGGAGARDLCHGGPGRDRGRPSCERVRGIP